MQRRIARKLELKMLLSHVEPHPTPTSELEQYTIPVDVAAEILHIASCIDDNIDGKSVLDLGCGTGRLALGAAFLGAENVVGVDIDRTAINIAVENSRKIGLKQKTDWLVADVTAVGGNFDTVLQNPPYGVQKENADRKFLEKALEVGRTIYSLHKSPRANRAFLARVKSHPVRIELAAASPFLKEFIEKRKGRIKSVYAMIMSIPHMFDFHTKRRHEFIVDLYVIEGSPSSNC